MNSHNNNLQNKFNDINAPNFVSPSLSLQTTKLFLEAYKKSNNKSIFTEKFLNNSNLYVEDSQIPESFIKLQKPFDRNQIFFVGNEGFNQRRNYGKFYRPKNKNFYPKYPLKLNQSCELVSKISDKKKKFEDPHDIMMNTSEHKIWAMKVMEENNMVQYGPYSSELIYLFLKNIYMSWTDEEKKKMNLLITDIVTDIYYLPDSLYEVLKGEFVKKTKDESNIVN